jgi:hypothetical protein
MSKPTPDQARESHRQHCRCKPYWKETDTGQALACGQDHALIWWPTVDASQLSMAQSAALFVVGPMQYDSDGDTANDMLLKLGYNAITPDNLDSAIRDLKHAFERELWQDNVGKQLLGRLFDGDLGGEA